MLTSRFTSTLRRARRRDPVDRLTVTIAGSSCGVSPIAIASENSSASMNGRCSNMLMTKIDTVSTPATRTRRNENLLQADLERGLASAARRGRRRSRRTGVPCPCARRRRPRNPPCTIVPMSAHEPAPCSTGVGRLLDRHRLPGEHRLVALELGDVEQADVGRDDVADARGARRRRARASTTSTRCGRAVADDERGLADLRVQRLDRLLGSVLVDEAEPDRQRRRSRAMITRVGGIAGEPETRPRPRAAAPATGCAADAANTAQPRAPWLRNAFGPYSTSRRRASSELRPCGPEASAAEDVGGRPAGGFVERQLLRYDGRHAAMMSSVVVIVATSASVLSITAWAYSAGHPGDGVTRHHDLVPAVHGVEREVRHADVHRDARRRRSSSRPGCAGSSRVACRSSGRARGTAARTRSARINADLRRAPAPPRSRAPAAPPTSSLRRRAGRWVGAPDRRRGSPRCSARPSRRPRAAAWASRAQFATRSTAAAASASAGNADGDPTTPFCTSCSTSAV